MIRAPDLPTAQFGDRTLPARSAREAALATRVSSRLKKPRRSGLCPCAGPHTVSHSSTVTVEVNPEKSGMRLAADGEGASAVFQKR